MVLLWRIPDDYPEEAIGLYDRTSSPDEYLFKEGAHVSTSGKPTIRFEVRSTALAGFAFHYFDAGRRWLAATAIGLRLVSLVINFTVGDNLNWLEVQALREVTFLGDVVRVPVGVSNPGWQSARPACSC
jgi:hypothetical protein